MKKFTAMALALLLSLAAVGCAGTPSQSPEAAGSVTGQTEATPQPSPEGSGESGVDWAAEYDVVVIGYGGAGASAAIAAAGEGAKVLVVEKAPEGPRAATPR